MPGRDFCIPRPGAQIDCGLAQVQGWLSAKPSPLRAQQVPHALGCRGVSSQELTTALCSQGKGRRESEGPTSCRRPSGRSPTSAEKCMSFESVSSLPEVSGQQAEGASSVVPGAQVSRSAGWPFRPSRWAHGEKDCPPPRTLAPLGKPVWPMGAWLGEQTAPFYELEKGSPSFGQISPLPKGIVSRSDQILGPLC